MIFDAGAYLGEWPFRDLQGTLPGLRQLMRRHHITHALVSPFAGFFYIDPMPANVKLLQALRDEKNLYAAPIVNAQFADIPHEINTLAEHPRVKAIRLAPGFHHYECRLAANVVTAAAQHQLPIIIQTKFQDRRHHPAVANMAEVSYSEALDLAASTPEVNFLIAASHISEVMQHTAHIIALPNVWLDMSHLDGLACIRRVVDAIGANRLLLSTCWPFFYAQPALLKVLEAQLPAKEQAMVLGGSAAQLFGIM